MCGATLSVITKEENEDGLYSVFWATPNQTGVVPVRVEVDTDDRLIMAEIWGLRHLLITKEVLGQDRTGEGLTLNVSRGAIKKLILRTSSKTELIKHAIWLRTRFSDADIRCPKKTINPDDIRRRLSDFGDAGEPLLTIREDSSPHDYIDTSIGQVRISCHSVMRMQERLDLKNHAASWRVIRRILRKNGLETAMIPRSVLIQKRKQYDEDALYLNSPSGWQMVFVPVEGGLVLTTIYKQPSQSFACAA